MNLSPPGFYAEPNQRMREEAAVFGNDPVIGSNNSSLKNIDAVA